MTIHPRFSSDSDENPMSNIAAQLAASGILKPLSKHLQENMHLIVQKSNLRDALDILMGTFTSPSDADKALKEFYLLSLIAQAKNGYVDLLVLCQNMKHVLERRGSPTAREVFTLKDREATLGMIFGLLTWAGFMRWFKSFDATTLRVTLNTPPADVTNNMMSMLRNYMSEDQLNKISNAEPMTNLPSGDTSRFFTEMFQPTG